MAVVLALVAGAVAALLAALFYGVWTLALLGLTAGLAQAIAKFSLDATIQRDIPTQVQASAFGRSDTTCQLAWVLGGFVGIAIPLDPPRLGLTVAFVALAAWTAYVLATAPRGRRRRRLDAQARAQQADIDTQPMPVQRRETAARRSALTPLRPSPAGLASGARSQLVGERAEQLGGRARGAAVGVPPVAVGLADAVEQPDQVLDDRGHLVGLPALGVRLVALDRDGLVDDPDLERLVAAAALGDPELHAGAGLDRGHALGQGIRAQVDVGAVLLGQEPEALLGVEPLHLACGHGLTSRSLTCAARRRTWRDRQP